MNTLMIFILIPTLIAATLALYWLDARYQWQLVDWCNGRAGNPFKAKEVAKANPANDEVAALRERIETLEAIVTDRAWELQEKIRQLD